MTPVGVMPSSDLTVLFNKSYGRHRSERALNSHRAAHALRIDRQQLVVWAAAEGLTFVRDTVNHSWLIAGTPPVDERLPVFLVEPDTWGFGAQAVGGGATAPKNFVVRNVGDRSGRIGAVELQYGAPFFAIDTDTASAATVPPGGTVSFNVTFDPAAAQAYTGTIYVPNNSEEAPNIRVNLSGTGA
jgi:hypothetical protein